jgi:glutathione synthase/RimK-type ligase-like ATP-grasp enzyme
MPLQIDDWEICLKYFSVDASSELKARGVQSGDKVLEVNDIMVTDATVEKVTNFIL